jgi:hypothetical protein
MQTGVARASSSSARHREEIKAEIGWPGSISPMASSTTGMLKQAANQKRRDMSSSSGSAGCSTLTIVGSNAMPHFGQSPGSSRTTSGCIGQVHSVFVVARTGDEDSSAMPQCGQLPGPGSSTLGHIGQIQRDPAPVFVCAAGARATSWSA